MEKFTNDVEKQQLKNQNNHQTKLYKIFQAFASELNLANLLKVAVETIQVHTKWSHIIIALLNEVEMRWIIKEASSNFKTTIGQKHSFEVGIIGRALNTEETQVVPNIKQDADYIPHHPAMQSELAIPLSYNYQLLGVLDIQSTNPNAFSFEDVQFAQSIAESLAIALKNALQFEEVSQQAADLSALYTIIRMSRRSVKSKEVLKKALASILVSLGYQAGKISIINAKTDSIDLLIEQGTATTLNLVRQHDNLVKEICAYTYQYGQTITIDNTERPIPTQLISTVKAIKKTNLQVCLFIPLNHQNKTVGILQLFTQHPYVFSISEITLLDTVGHQIAIALSNAQLFEDIIKTQKALAKSHLELQQANENLQKLNHRMQSDLNLARKIQQSLLPPPNPQHAGLDIMCHTTSAYEVGGDFYIYNAFTNKHFCLAIGDVSGKGMAASLLMVMTLIYFDTTLANTLSPKEFIEQLDTSLTYYAGVTHQNCALCYIEIEDNMLHVVNAGCVSPYLKRANGTVDMLDIGGLPLGIGLGGYQSLSIPLSIGDFIILSSDGVVEANDTANNIFGFERFTKAIETAPTNSAEAMLNYLKTEIAKFVGTAEPHDDLTIVVLKIVPP